MVKMPRTFQNHQSNAGCSNFFNLKPNAGTKTFVSSSTQKSGKDFLESSANIANTKGDRSWEEQKQKGIWEMHRKVYLFKMRNLPSAL